MQIFGDSNLKRLKAAHGKVVANTKTAVAVELTQAGQHAVDHVKRYPGFKPRTGNLQDKTEWRTVKTGTGRILRVQNKAPYAGAIDRGAKPHLIRAKRAKTLRFVSNGKVVFRRSVKHPGNRPYRFLYKATNSAGRVFQQGLEKQMRRIAKQF